MYCSAAPKSTKYRRSWFAPRPNMKFSGLMSRTTTLRECTWRNASTWHPRGAVGVSKPRSGTRTPLRTHRLACHGVQHGQRQLAAQLRGLLRQIAAQQLHDEIPHLTAVAVVVQRHRRDVGVSPHKIAVHQALPVQQAAGLHFRALLARLADRISQWGHLHGILIRGAVCGMHWAPHRQRRAHPRTTAAQRRAPRYTSLNAPLPILRSTTHLPS